MINEKTIVSTVSLLASLTSYFYAKECNKDVVPYVMVGGFIGAIIGEAIAGIVLRDNNDNENKDNNNS